MEGRAIRIFAVALLCFAAASAAHGASIALGSATAAAGSNGVRIASELGVEGTEEVSGAQFLVVYDSDVFTIANVEAGPAAVAAMKDVSFHETAAGETVVVITSLTNRTVIAAGTLARIVFSIAADAPRTSHALALENVVLTDPGGRGVAATAHDGAITVTEAPPPGCGAMIHEDGRTSRGSWIWPALIALSAVFAADRSRRQIVGARSTP